MDGSDQRADDADIRGPVLPGHHVDEGAAPDQQVEGLIARAAAVARRRRRPRQGPVAVSFSGLPMQRGEHGFTNLRPVAVGGEAGVEDGVARPRLHHGAPRVR